MSRLAPVVQHYDTIVIGAGVAGLGCASRLLNDPTYQKPGGLLVLEARNRIGGRINAVSVNGCRLDTGAHWIHGVGTAEKPNPLMKILPHKRCRELTGTVVFKAPDAVASPRSRPNAEVSQVVPTEVAGPLMSATFGIMDELRGIATKCEPSIAKETAMLESIASSRVLREAMHLLPEEFHRTLRSMPQLIESVEAAPLTSSSAAQSKGGSALGLAEYAIDDFDGQHVFLQDGYTAVVDELARELIAANVIELDCQVESIRRDHSSFVHIDTLKSGRHARYTAKSVVCTLPLGVLQCRQSAMHHGPPLFQPALPSRLTKAITSLGFGTLNKIFSVYERPWWLEEPYYSRYKGHIVDMTSASEQSNVKSPDVFMGFTDELPGLEIGLESGVRAGVRLLDCLNLHNLTGYPALSTFVSCSNAVHIESLCDADAGAIVHRALTQWFGCEPPSPVAVRITRWAKDKFSRGSYSHMVKGLSEIRHRETFEEPVSEDGNAMIRFAGEHTSRDHFATVHGALLSGWREADAILQSANA